MRALVLAAGLGTRLLPLTRYVPKPMFPVMNKPVMEYALELLRSFDIRDIAVNLHHLPDKITHHFGAGEAFGVRLNYSREDTILGTAGGIKALQSFLDGGPFIVINSDVFVNIDLNQVIEFHKKKGSCLTLVLRPGNKRFDPIEVAPDGRIVHFMGAGNAREVTSRVTFTGIQIMEPEIFARIPENRFCGTTDEVFPAMIKENLPIYGYMHTGYWNDMGNPESYLELHKDLFDGKARLENRKVFESPKGALIIPPVRIGKECKISGNAQLGPYATLGDNCRLKNGAVVEHSVCWDGVEIGIDSTVRSSILGNGVTIGDKKEIVNMVLGEKESRLL